MTITATPLLLCDGLWENPRNHKIHLDGVFTTLRATRFPTPERILNVYAQLHGEIQERGALVLECVELSTSTCLWRSEGPVVLGSQGRRHIRFASDNFRFPNPGRYGFTLTCDGRLIGEQTLDVREVQT